MFGTVSFDFGGQAAYAEATASRGKGEEGEMARRVSAVVARNIARAEAEELSFEPAATAVHVHEACGGRGCGVCDKKGAWLVAIGVYTLPAKPPKKDKPPVSPLESQQKGLDALALRPRM